jgi:hypothetical protein
LITTIERSKRYVSIPGEHGGKKSSGPDHGPAEKVGSSLNILRTFLRFQVSRLNPAILSRIGKLGDNISVTMGKYDCIDGYGEEEQSFDIADLRQTARQELVRRKQKK